MSEQPISHVTPRDFVAVFDARTPGLHPGPVEYRWGKVDAVQDSPPRLSVRVSGSAVAQWMPYMDGLTYAVGDVVRVVAGLTPYVDGRIRR